jgi:hypothetical protein
LQLRSFVASLALQALLVAHAEAMPAFVNGSLTGTPGAEIAAPGWAIANGTPDVVDADGPFNNTGVPWTLSPDGGTFARGNGNGDPMFEESFEQSVSGFSPGMVYRVDLYQATLGFRVSGTGEWRNHPGYWAILVDGVRKGQSNGSNGPVTSTDPVVWVDESIEFLATQGTHTLEFRPFSTAAVVENSTQVGYMGIDGLELSLVPEPAADLSLATALLVLLSFAGGRRGRRGFPCALPG